MEIYFDEQITIDDNIKETMKKAASQCVNGEGIDSNRTEISVTFVDKDTIKSLNRDYRHVDKVTDVLSFPQFDDLTFLPDFGEIILGDVVICKDRAKEQAQEFGHSFEREIIYLFTHSILHLLGYDHMFDEDKDEMRKREEEVMDTLGIPRRTDSIGDSEDAAESEISDYPSLITEEDKMLFKKATKALENAYAPYSGFRVGAALLTYSGDIFTGVNVENASYGGTICAERTACCKAVSEGYKDFTAIAIAAENGEALPCGICRQFLSEFAPDLKIITGENVETLRVQSLKELLPESFKL